MMSSYGCSYIVHVEFVSRQDCRSKFLKYRQRVKDEQIIIFSLVYKPHQKTTGVTYSKILTEMPLQVTHYELD